MATITIPVKHLDDMTECAICTDIYIDPRVLPCVHSYCLQCLDEWCRGKQPGETSKCPMCMKDFNIPSGGIGEFPKNFVIDQLLTLKATAGGTPNAHGNSNRNVCACAVRKPETRKSGLKRKASARVTSYCIDCCEKLCDACATTHSPTSRQHQIIRLSDDDEVKSPSVKYPPSVCTVSCSKHADEFLQIFCRECKLPACIVCHSDVHSAHKCCDIGEAAAEFDHRIASEAKSMSDGVQRCRAVLEELRKKKKNFSEKVVRTESLVGEHFEHVRQTIEGHCRQIMTEITTLKHKRFREIDQLVEEVETHMSEMESLWVHFNEVLSSGTVCDIVHIASNSLDRADEGLTFERIDRSLDKLRGIDVTFTASEFLDEFDAEQTIGEITDFSTASGANDTHGTLYIIASISTSVHSE